MNGYLAIVAAVSGFFLNSLFEALMARARGPRFGLATFNCPDAMLAIIAIQLSVAPLAATGRGRRWNT